MIDKIKIKLTPQFAKVFLNYVNKDQVNTEKWIEYVNDSIKQYQKDLKTPTDPYSQAFSNDMLSQKKDDLKYWTSKKEQLSIYKNKLNKGLQSNKTFDFEIDGVSFLDFAKETVGKAISSYDKKVDEICKKYIQDHNLKGVDIKAPYYFDLKNDIFLKTFPQYKRPWTFGDPYEYAKLEYSNNYEEKKANLDDYVKNNIKVSILPMPSMLQKYLGKDFINLFFNPTTIKQAVAIKKQKAAIWRAKADEQDQKRWSKQRLQKEKEIKIIMKKHKVNPKEKLPEPVLKIK